MFNLVKAQQASQESNRGILPTLAKLEDVTLAIGTAALSVLLYRAGFPSNYTLQNASKTRVFVLAYGAMLTLRLIAVSVGRITYTLNQEKQKAKDLKAEKLDLEESKTELTKKSRAQEEIITSQERKILDLSTQLSVLNEKLTLQKAESEDEYDSDSDTESVSSESSTLEESSNSKWQESYDSLLARIKDRGVSPLNEDNPNIFKEIVNDFIKIFDLASEKERAKLIESPLYPTDSTPEWTKPLNYIIFTADADALEKVELYLKNEAWKAKGPYCSTFVHCLISGMQMNCSQQPVACLKILLSHDSSLRSQTNGFSQTPLFFLESVKDKLNNNLKHIEEYGGSAFMRGSYITSRDCKGGSYNEYSTQYGTLLSAAKTIKNILQGDQDALQVSESEYDSSDSDTGSTFFGSDSTSSKSESDSDSDTDSISSESTFSNSDLEELADRFVSFLGGNYEGDRIKEAPEGMIEDITGEVSEGKYEPPRPQTQLLLQAATEVAGASSFRR